MTRALLVGAIAAPFVLVWPQSLLIPSWYEASLYVAGGLLLLHVVAAVVAIKWLLRRGGWRPPARIAACLGLLLLAVVAAFTTWAGCAREGTFLCGRTLTAAVDCPGGGQVFEFESLCISGNPDREIAVRPNLLPFMYPASARTSAEACAAR